MKAREKRILLMLFVLAIVFVSDIMINRYINAPRNEVFLEKFPQTEFNFEKEKILFGLSSEDIEFVYDDSIAEPANVIPTADGYEIRMKPSYQNRWILRHELCHVRDRKQFGFFYNLLPPSYREWKATSCAADLTIRTLQTI